MPRCLLAPGLRNGLRAQGWPLQGEKIPQRLPPDPCRRQDQSAWVSSPWRGLSPGSRCSRIPERGVTLRCAPAGWPGLSLPCPELFLFPEPGPGGSTGGANKGLSLGLDLFPSHWAFRFLAQWLPELQPLPLISGEKNHSKGVIGGWAALAERRISTFQWIWTPVGCHEPYGV